MIKIDKEKQRGILISAGIILVTLIIGAKIIYQPQQAQTVKLKAEIKKEMEKNSLMKDIISAQNALKRYQDRFSPQPDISWLSERVNQSADTLNIEILEIEEATSAGEIPGFIPLSVEVKVRANYYKIGKLVSQLEKSREFIEVTKINLVSVPSKSWDKLTKAGEGKTIPASRRRGRSPIIEEEIDDEFAPAELETLLNKSREIEAVLEVTTYYVQ